MTKSKLPYFYGATEKTFEHAKNLRKPQTPAEVLLWKALRNRKNIDAKFRRQHPIGRFIVDFYCHEALLVIEVDGEIHDFVKEYDENRQFEIEKFDIMVIRFTNDEVLGELTRVLKDVEKVVIERKSNLSTPSS